jgi:hypothetical protein
MALIEMQDDVNIGLMHEPVQAWAGYVGGNFPMPRPSSTRPGTSARWRAA